MRYESSNSKHIYRTDHAVYRPIVLSSGAFHNILEPLEKIKHLDDILVNTMDVPHAVSNYTHHISMTIYLTREIGSLCPQLWPCKH